jgi:hypothetical protein
MFTHEKHSLFGQTRFFWCATALVFPLAWGCGVTPSEMEQRSTMPGPVLASTRSLESPRTVESTLASELTLASNDVELAETCELEPNCCGDLDCAPAPCPIFCL